MSDPTANNVLVETLGSSLRSGGSALDDVPALLKRVLHEEAWRCFVTRLGNPVEHERFADFVTTPPLAGLGASVDLVKRIVADDPEATKLLRDALKERPGPSGSGNNSTRTTVTGTSRAYALDRLERDAPELHAEVLAGALSPHAAMVKAGFRPHTFTVRADRPESVAVVLRRNMSADDVAKLAALLLEVD